MLCVKNNIKWLVSLLILFSLLAGCVEKDVDPSDPSAAFARARESYDNEMFEVAIQKLGEFKSRFPYSKHAPDAELLIADSHYQLGQFAEAAAAYELFVKLHPRHEKADFAQFRIGESYWAEAPEEIDREQDFTQRAIAEWDKLLKNYPNGQYNSKALNLLEKGQRRVAEHANFIAKFYCKKAIYHACAYRYLELAEQYAQFQDLASNAYLKASTAFEMMSKTKPGAEPNDSNIYFKSMNPDQLREKANQLRLKAEQIKSAASPPQS